MRNLITKLGVAAAILAGALMVPAAAQAQCRGCEIDLSGCYRCLLGCSVGGYWCSTFCSASCDWCSMGPYCGTLAMGADGTVLALGTGEDDGETTAEEEFRFVRFVSGDGDAVYRRACDAAVMARRYTPAAVQRGRNEARLIRI